MSWTDPPDWATIPIPGAMDMNTYVRANLIYNYNGRSHVFNKIDHNANYTTSSTAFVDVDTSAGTFIAVLNITSGKAQISFSIVAGPGIFFDILIDGTRYASGGADGLTYTADASMTKMGAGACITVEGLSPGSHTFKLQWKVASGTGTLYSGAGSAGTDFLSTFNVMEIG